MMSRMVSWLLGVVVLCGTAPMLYAQGLTGQISGSVVDASGSVLPGATVTIKNTGTQIARETTTDEAGTFVVTELLAGTYDESTRVGSFPNVSASIARTVPWSLRAAARVPARKLLCSWTAAAIKGWAN